jgi:hypothetical protein
MDPKEPGHLEYSQTRLPASSLAVLRAKGRLIKPEGKVSCVQLSVRFEREWAARVYALPHESPGLKSGDFLITANFETELWFRTPNESMSLVPRITLKRECSVEEQVLQIEQVTISQSVFQSDKTGLP